MVVAGIIETEQQPFLVPEGAMIAVLPFGRVPLD
jgi:hypothetical protein